MKLTVVVPEELGARVREAAWGERVSLSAWLRAAVEERLGPTESALAVLLPQPERASSKVRVAPTVVPPMPPRVKSAADCPLRNNAVSEIFGEKK